MGSKEDWEELEKWSKEQEEKKTKEEKFYTQGFNNKKVKNIKIFSAIFKFLTNSFFAILTGILTITAVLAIIFSYGKFKEVTPQDTLKYLKDIYNGEEFKIINYEGEDKYQKGKGIYILSPKSNPNIIFKAYNNKNGITQDYEQQRVKYYIDNCKDKSLLEGFEINENIENTENMTYLSYGINLYFNSYNELEDKVEKIYNLEKYLNSKDENIYSNVTLINKNLNYYFGMSYVEDLEYMKYRFKDNYIRFVKENNCTNESKNIGQEELTKYYRPENLSLIINGKQMKLYNNFDAGVYYYWNTKEYFMSWTEAFLDQIDSIEVVKKGTFSGNVKKIKYHNKVYKIEYKNSGKKSNVIYIGGSLEKFLENFDSEIKYDFENKKVYVTIK